MSDTISISGHEFKRLDGYGLDSDVIGEPEFRNERDSGYGDSEGEWFYPIDTHNAPDGTVYSVLVTGTHGNDHSPGSSHNTHFELYPHRDPAYIAAVREWQDKPEDDPDAELYDESDDA